MNNNGVSTIDFGILFFATLFFLHRSSFIAFHTPSFLWAGVVIALFSFLVYISLKSTNWFIYLIPIITIDIIWKICKSPSLYDLRSFLILLSVCMQTAILPLLTHYLFRKKNINCIIYIFLIFCFVEITTGISTIIACSVDPTLARMDYGTLRAENPALYAYRMNLNVGDYHTTYGFTAMLPIVVVFLKNARFLPHSNHVRLFCLFSYIIMIYTVYSASYTISLIVCCILALTIIFPSKISKPFFYVSIIFALLCYFALQSFIPPLLNYIAEILDSDIMSARLYDLADSLNFGANTARADSDFNLRMLCYEKSWNSFINNPIFGSLDYKQSGGHSFILDNLGLMGLIGFMLLIIMLKTIWNRYIVVFKRYKWFYYYGYALIAIIIFFFLNPDGMETQLLFFYPISGYILAYYTRFK